MRTTGGGEFTTTIKPLYSATITAAAQPVQPVYETSRQSVELVVRQPVKLSIGGTMEANGHLDLRGKAVPSHLDLDLDTAQILLEYSKDGRTRWTEYDRTRPDHGKLWFTLDKKVPGYWRARFAGSDLASPAVSNVVKF